MYAVVNNGKKGFFTNRETVFDFYSFLFFFFNKEKHDILIPVEQFPSSLSLFSWQGIILQSG